MIGAIQNALDSSSNHTSPVVSVSKSVIANNTAKEVGAGAYVQLHEDVKLSVATLEFYESVFDNNVNLNKSRSRGGSAFNLINFRVPGYTSHHSPLYEIFIVSCNFTRNWEEALSDDSVGSGTLFVEENAHMVLKDCLFEDNDCTGITAVHSNILLEGVVVLRNNRGYNGGGMVMCANSILFLNHSKEVEVIIEDCHADNFGGGIYAEFECSKASPPCFFQTGDSTDVSKARIHLHNNTATRAGTALYGGAVDICYAYGPYNKSNMAKFFDKLFDIEPASENILSRITSNPINVCFCTNGMPVCEETLRISEEQVYPGGTLSVSVVVVGQRNGTVPGLVVANSLDHNVHIEGQPDRLIEDATCTSLSYIIKTNSKNLPQDVQFNFKIGDRFLKCNCSPCKFSSVKCNNSQLSIWFFNKPGK